MTDSLDAQPSKRESHIVPLAVVGHAGVGKTTLIKRELPFPPSTSDVVSS